MMKMAMKLDKSQVGPSVIKYTASGSTFKKSLYAMALFTKYDVLIVGASGGRSGRAGGVISGRTVYVYPAGGGGGQSKLVSGLLKDLPASVSPTVGVQGGNGADIGATTTSTRAGTGGTGGSSTWNGVTAVGGAGGVGGSVYSTNPDFIDSSVGGMGGGQTAVQSGTWYDAANPKYGTGGGGGRGEQYDSAWGGPQGVVQAGLFGAANGAANAYKADGEAVQQSYYGGGGGGCNIAPITGGPAEVYGTGYNTGHGGGVVVVKLS